MKGIKRKSLLFLVLIASLCFSLGGSAYAFNDIAGDREKAAIEQLEKDGIIGGNGQGTFSPGASVNAATAVSLIVKGMELNIDNIRFIKAPKASDYFTKVKDDAWYAQAFIIASLNGLEVPKDIDPAAKVSREQYAHWLYKAIERKGDYAWIEIYIMMNDEAQVNSAYMNSIQRLIIGKIATLDAKQNFHPKQAITRSEAAGMLYRAREFVKNMKPIGPVEPNPETTVLTDVKLTTEKVNDSLQKVTVSAMAPHPGYGIEISSIDFSDDGASVNYRLILPDPAAFYAQVITEVKASASIMAYYKPVLGHEEPAGSRKQETENGTKIEPVETGSTPVLPSTKHPIMNPDGTTGSTGTVDGKPNGR